MRHQQDRNEVANDLTLFGLSNESRAEMKRRYMEGRAKIREVMLFYGVKKECAEDIVAGWIEATEVENLSRSPVRDGELNREECKDGNRLE